MVIDGGLWSGRDTLTSGDGDKRMILFRMWFSQLLGGEDPQQTAQVVRPENPGHIYPELSKTPARLVIFYAAPQSDRLMTGTEYRGMLRVAYWAHRHGAPTDVRTFAVRY